MKYLERIDLVCDEEDRDAVLELVRREGFDVEPVQKTIVRQMIEHDRYSPDARNRLKAVVDAHDLQLRLFSGGVQPIYEDGDYERADGVTLILPDIRCKKRLPSWRTRCEECRQLVVRTDYTFQLPRLATRRSIGDLNDAPVISQSLFEQAIGMGLTGLAPKPLTTNGDYFWLDTNTRFSERYLPDDEVIDFRGRCPQCGNYLWDNAIGPYRFQRDQWPDEDFMLYVVGFPRLLCSKRAYEFLSQFEKKIYWSNLIFVE